MAAEDASRWDAKYRDRPQPQPGASEALRSVEAWLPTSGAALDVAGGDGAQAAWLVQRGLAVTLCDVSAVALSRAEAMAGAHGLQLGTHRIDLEDMPLPAGPWDLVLCCNYLQPSLWGDVARCLTPEGRAVWLHPTVENLSRHAKPSRRFLLEPGQGREVFEAAGLEVSFAEESWVGGRHLSRVVGALSRSARH